MVNTHAHFDHVLGNGAFREAYPDVLLVGHETVPDGVREEAGLKGMEPVPPDTLLASVWTGDLGDRYVEAVHPGRGHSAGDVVVRVPDADVVYAGDIVEDPGRRRTGRTAGRWSGRSSWSSSRPCCRSAAPWCPGTGRW